jgi:hypothetical protein
MPHAAGPPITPLPPCPLPHHQMYTYYLRPILVGHEATLTPSGAADEAHR